jgi:predicted GNAT family N-acyltransferase
MRRVSVQVARCTTSELDSVRAIRRAVFVDEQRVPAELELDGLDGEAEHYLARMGDRPVGTARARRTAKGWKLERVAVVAAERRSGVGRALVRHVLQHAPADAVVYVHAQESALGFWLRVGFIAEGPSFEEAGIVHRWMRLERVGG